MHDLGYLSTEEAGQLINVHPNTIVRIKYDRPTLNSQEIFAALQQASHQAGIRLFNTFAELTQTLKHSTGQGINAFFSPPQRKNRPGL